MFYLQTHPLSSAVLEVERLVYINAADTVKGFASTNLLTEPNYAEDILSFAKNTGTILLPTRLTLLMLTCSIFSETEAYIDIISTYNYDKINWLRL
jgi:hypothetical protein